MCENEGTRDCLLDGIRRACTYGIRSTGHGDDGTSYTRAKLRVATQ